ncbi:hypothetical protein K710_1121 [Streptococcus iniae SF1]|nr:hypothetical protein [Streptococcus iniae]AGM98893.1 hypothetical protein K710_1121 [Streptococcus iniae SF1]EKB52791.1 hypothetical protein A0G_0626 [Streptococcus iniae 9117]
MFYYDQKSQFIFIRNEVILHQDEECSQIKMLIMETLGIKNAQ